MHDSVPVTDRPRFDFLHGLRGLAALTVVLFHATLNAQGSSNPVLRALQEPLLHGYLAVSVFLVLSGFLLAVPVVTHGLSLRGGIRGFMRRRAIRILPPYYAAYVLDLLFFAGAIGLASITGLDPGQHVWSQREVGFGWSSIAAHLLLIHNASEAWVVGMDAILWSIACEWQIYLLFAVVLLPVWRRAGSWAMLAVAAVAAAVIIEGCARGWWSYHLPWMIPIFAIGALSAVVVVGEHPAAVAMRRWRWGWIAAVTTAVAVAGVLLLDRLQTAVVPGGTPVRYYYWSFRVMWIYDVLAAVATASFVTWLALDIRHGGGTTRAAARARSLLESRPLFALGLFSYSLYLTHGLVVVSVVRATTFLGHAPTLRACVVMVAVVAISLAFAYGFYLLVERRCMSAETRAMFTPAAGQPREASVHPAPRARPAASASARPPETDRSSRP